jgi:hypothetical protein
MATTAGLPDIPNEVRGTRLLSSASIGVSIGHITAMDTVLEVDEPPILCRPVANRVPSVWLLVGWPALDKSYNMILAIEATILFVEIAATHDNGVRGHDRSHTRV